MTLTNEQIEALAVRVSKGYTDWMTHQQAAAALRQWIEERKEHEPKPCCGEWNTCDEQCLPLIQHLREAHKDLQDDYLRRNHVSAVWRKEKAAPDTAEAAKAGGEDVAG